MSAASSWLRSLHVRCSHRRRRYRGSRLSLKLAAGAFFTTYEGTKALLHRVDHVSSSSTAIVPEPLINAAASSAGELVSCLILTPAEVLKQNAQVVKRGAHTGAGSMFDGGATRTALKRFRRPGQLWRGYTALAARNLPFTAMQFPLFEHFKKGLLARRPEHRKAADSLLERGIITGVAAGTAGSVAAVITTPIDVVKTRIMLAAGSDESAAAAAPREKKSAAELEIRRAEASSARGRPGTWAVGREVFRVEGVRGLFRGGALRGAWTALGSGLYLSIYESGRAYLERRRHGQDHARGASIA